MPPAYVRTLFDQYAPQFDRALIDDLGYRGPSLLFKAVLAARHAVKEACLLQARDRPRLRHGPRGVQPLPRRSIISSASICRPA